MAKIKRAKKKKRRKRAWIRVTFEELDSWRERRKIPKKRMAEILGDCITKQMELKKEDDEERTDEGCQYLCTVLEPERSSERRR